MDKVPQEIVDACEEELGCMMDALEGGLEGAIQERSAKMTLVAQCSPESGSCANGFKCCGGLNCLDFGNEKKCSSKSSLADFECMVRVTFVCSFSAEAPFANTWPFLLLN
jgi:hypothetical protein